MGQRFNASLGLQNISDHIERLTAMGYHAIEDKTTDKRKLHDLWDWYAAVWFECKTDWSGFNERFLIEAKSNLPYEYVKDLPLRQPIPFAQLNSLVSVIPNKYDALSRDNENIEPEHLLSYMFGKTKAHYLLDLRQLREQIRLRKYDWIVFQSPQESNGATWYTIAQIVPIKDCQLID